jgi:predicted O-methyltransferase YrrM
MVPINKEFRARPWLVAASIRYLEKRISKTSSVLETGAGGSTFWFARLAASVVTFEHAPEWFAKVKKELETRKIENVRLVFAPEYPQTGIPLNLGEFDVILIDGRGRVRSIETAVDLLKKGGIFVLDNAERERYRVGVRLLNQRFGEPKRFVGAKRWETAIWRS